MDNASWESRNESQIRGVIVDQHAKARAEGRNERAQALAACFDNPDIVDACGYIAHYLRMNVRALVEAKAGPSLRSVIYKPRRARHFARSAA
jgi:hypothetical protein